MGPTILFDKSAIQSLGPKAPSEVSRYFYTVVPHVLLMEILADLSLDPHDLAGAQKKVAKLADKVFPLHSIVNAHYRPLCVHNLLGDAVPMTRRPAVGGARKVTATDGSQGMLIDVQPESEAVSRWRSGQFNSDDMKFAIEWRKAAKGTNLEEMKQVLPKPPMKLKTADEVRSFADLLLTQPEAQLPLLMWFMSLLRCDPSIRQKILVRWKFHVSRMLPAFAPYACHCLRVQLIYYTGMLQGVFGTRSTNIVDLEYLAYMPFASIFCSGDKLHNQLAPLILGDDQSYVKSDEMRQSLFEAADSRETLSDVEPTEGSLIQQLWRKHWPPNATSVGRGRISEEQTNAIMESVKPIIDALEAQAASEHKPRFPV